MICCGGLGRSAYLIFVSHIGHLCFSGSKVLREVEYDFLGGVGDPMTPSCYFLPYLGGSCKCVLPLQYSVS